MQATMLISVRVGSAQAQRELMKLRATQGALNNEMAAANRNASRMTYGLPMLSKWGNQVQWAGRQLQYNFSLPLALAGAAATKFELENEKAMTRVTKVYGDGTRGAQFYKKEIQSLSKTFELLSNRFGVAQSDVINIAADWAAAGASGIALARATKLTMETMVLGEMNAADATKALISIQAQYGYSTKELSKTIDTLNMIENQTGISMQGLVEGFGRAAGVARSTGVDVEHLGAMLAALVPASGSAANAGNALKTIMSRLLSPTKEAAEVMGMMGINTSDAGWKSLSASQRLELMAKKYTELNKGVRSGTQELDRNGKATGRYISAQQAVISTVMASRWQINRWDVTMRDIANKHGYYQKALNSTTDAQKNFNQKVYELNAVLLNNPQRLKQMWTILQNAMANVIQPLIPYMVYLAQTVAQLANKFANLNPVVQKMVLIGLALLAVVGPVARYVGSVTTLFGILSSVLHFAAANLGLVAVETVAANGAIEMQRRGLLGLIFSWGAFFLLPFIKAFSAITWGFSATGKGLMALPRVLAIVAGNFKVAMASMVLTSRSFVTWLPGSWMSMWTRLLAFQALMATRFTSIFRYMLAEGFGLFRAFSAAMLVAVRTFGQLFTLSFARGMVNGVKTGILAIGRAFLGLPGLIAVGVLAAIGVVYSFRDKIRDAWNNVVKYFGHAGSSMMKALQPIVNGFWAAVNAIQRAFWSLPAGIRNALLAVVHIISQAAKAVYKWFSYLNPWAHHSPSLVESVTSGMDAVTSQFARAGNVGAIFRKASADLHAFENVAMRMKVAEASGNAKGTGALGPALLADYKALLPVMNRQKDAVDAQQAVVDKWDAALQKANDALDAQQNKLDTLQNRLDKLQSAYDAHKDAMDRYASATITGMNAADNAIFSNTQAQKQLQLQMLQWEQVYGSVEDATNSIAMLQGEIETLNGMQSDLRAAGAGSEITGPIKDQIIQLQAAAGEMTDSINNSPMAQWQSELDKLDIQGQIMELQKSLKFDGPIREIDQLVNGMNEMPFDQIVAGVQRERTAMDALQPSIDSATAAVDKQKAVVDAMTAARDAVQQRYDAENKSLDALNKRYQQTADLVNQLEQALNSLAQARDAADQAKKAKAKTDTGGAHALTPGGQNFKDAAGGGFPDPGGLGKIGREGGIGDQAALVDDFNKQLTDEIGKSFKNIDVFGPIKDMWHKVWAWVKNNIGPVVSPVVDGVKKAFSNFNVDFIDTSKISAAATKVGDVLGKIFDWGGKIARLFGPDLRRVWEALRDAAIQFWQQIGPQLKQFEPLFKPFMQVLGAIGIIIGTVVIGALKFLATMISNTLGPVLSAIIDILEGVIKMFRGVAEFVLGVLTGNWKMAFKGLWDIVSGFFMGLWGIIETVFLAIWKPIEGFFKAFWEIGVWIYNEFIGHSIIPDLVNGIIWWFNLMISVVKPIWNALVWLFQNVVAPVFTFLWNTVKSVMGWIGDAISFAWNDIIKPIWDGLVWVVQNILVPIFNGLWDVISKVWSWISNAIQWAWNNVIKPTWDNIKTGAQILADKFGDLWNKIGNVWDWIKDKIHAVWNSFIKPVFDAIKDGVLRVVDGFVNLWNKIKDVWDWIKDKISGAWNSLKPVFDKFKDISSSISDAFGTLKRKIGDAFDGVKTVIGGAIDWIKDKVNWALDKIGDLKDKASSIGGGLFGGFNFLFASGGVIPYADGGQVAVRNKNSGPFETSSPVALVGEGSRRWREFVIPTDPQYRKKATELWMSAGKDLGLVASDAVLFSNGGNVTPLVSSGASRDRHEGTTGVVWSGDAVTTVNIYGNLEFPNITDGEDAESFIENLKDLVG